MVKRQIGVGLEAEVVGFGDVAAVEGVAAGEARAFLAGRPLRRILPAAIHSSTVVRSSQGKRRRSCRSRRSPVLRMVWCSWGIMKTMIN
jgi:hypothetical protein